MMPADRHTRRAAEAMEAALALRIMTRVDGKDVYKRQNKRMLYYYFGSKEDLYIAVLERAYGAMRKACLLYTSRCV